MNPRWPGLFKVAEECGELLQILGKLGAYPDGDHPDGKGPLQDRLIEELGDVLWVVQRFAIDNDIASAVRERARHKDDVTAMWNLAGLPAERPEAQSLDSLTRVVAGHWSLTKKTTAGTLWWCATSPTIGGDPYPAQHHADFNKIADCWAWLHRAALLRYDDDTDWLVFRAALAVYGVYL